nr:glycosyltransferase [uncultured Draconibacterium sp.]
MPVYNSEKYIDEAIQSILNQAYKNFELIVVEDGSEDKTYEKLKLYDDARIRIIKNQYNIGLAASLNRAMKLAKGKYIARMDADDLCIKNRFSIQVRFLEENPNIDICGSFISRINYVGEVFRKKSVVPIKNRRIKATTMVSPAIYHPTVIFRAQTIQSYKITYDESFLLAQDFDLWSRLVFNEDIIFHNIPKVLLKYRDIQSKEEKYKRNYKQGILANKIRIRMLQNLGIENEGRQNQFNKLFQSNSLSKREILRIIIVVRKINQSTKQLFSAYPQINQLKVIYILGFTGCVLLMFREKLYRNLNAVKVLEVMVLCVRNYKLRRSSILWLDTFRK